MENVIGNVNRTVHAERESSLIQAYQVHGVDSNAIQCQRFGFDYDEKDGIGAYSHSPYESVG